MVTLTKSEVDALINDDSTGFVCFMGGVGCDREKQIYQAGNNYYLFTREEILMETMEYQEILRLQTEDSIEYMKGRFE